MPYASGHISALEWSSYNTIQYNAYNDFKLACDLLVDLQVAFAMFDKDGDGSITTQELRDVMTSLNIDINKRDVKRLIKKIDKDGK